MGKAYDGKKRWNETIAQSAGMMPSNQTKKAKKRYSGRTMKLSKAMKHVDEETRAIVRNARLDALEADNYGEDDVTANGDGADDDLYVEEEQERSKPIKLSSNKRQQRQTNNKKRKWKVKNLAQLVFEEFGADGDASTNANQSPNYWTVAAKPSKVPARHFCCVCGFFASYACTRCGSRFCRVRCSDHHKETGCLKFGL